MLCSKFREYLTYLNDETSSNVAIGLFEMGGLVENDDTLRVLDVFLLSLSLVDDILDSVQYRFLPQNKMCCLQNNEEVSEKRGKGNKWDDKKSPRFLVDTIMFKRKI